MAESTEVEDRVDLEEDNYMEEMDDDVEEQVEEDPEEEGGDGNFEENDDDEEYDHSKAGASEKDQSAEANRNDDDTPHVEEEEKPTASVGEDEKDKHAQLLALPPNGSEVFIGGLPKDASEEDLRDLCEPIGDVFEVRLMKDKESGESKGFAFVSFRSKEFAKKAIDELHSKELKGKTIRCSLSETKNRLFIGNVPKNWTEDEFRKVIEDVGPGVETIELIKVKALYVKNIPDNTSTEKIKELFQRHGEVTKVVMPPGKSGKRDFGFIHYAERSSALKAVKDTEKYEIDVVCPKRIQFYIVKAIQWSSLNFSLPSLLERCTQRTITAGQVLEVVLAKPQTDKKTEGTFPYSPGLVPTHLPHAGYGGFAGTPYGSVGAGFGVAAGFQQPMIYGRGPMPSGMHMVPMVLPDGQIGYVLQQPGVQMPPPRPRRVDRSNGPGGRGGRGGSSGGDDGNRGRRYRPY
ncbi:hypothetical protein CUMW_051350 [Citrus unshiu]|nr:hypothetical protein CUMW_051350 [Citrus unshiu]